MSVIRSMLKRLEVYLGGKSLNRNDVDRQHLLFKINLAIVNLNKILFGFYELMELCLEALICLDILRN